MVISATQQQDMQKTASGESLSDKFKAQFEAQYGAMQDELNYQKGIRDKQNAAQPGAEANIRAVGDYTDRASGQNPLDIAKQGMSLRESIGTIKEGTSKNILQIMAEMTSMNKQLADMDLAQQRLELDKQNKAIEFEKFKASLAEKNMIWDEKTKEARGMTADELKKAQASGMATANLDPVTLGYLELFKNGSMKKVSEIPAGDRSKVVQAMANNGINLEAIAKEREGKGITSTLQQMFNLYYGGASESDDLSKGRFWGTASKIAGAVGANPSVKNYENFKNGILASIKAVTGDTGILTDQDAERIKSWLPSPTDTKEEAQGNWKLINNLLQGKYGISLDTAANPAVGKDTQQKVSAEEDPAAKFFK